ncbi:uncharacterized protein LOC115432446 [Sphaeramia orbicularis]|uniref:uncharacterized protein LOC115432446 n=1 Tax=Sphaeramia orbicularis TaxID=375764 RepID=UPI00117F7356|nr:uncharacterized protein LOC115432446 [Sphaeramia orbicularis]
MSKASFERHWKKDLTCILEELTDDQYQKMLECLDNIPQQKKSSVKKAEMPKVIIEHLGVNDSILAICEAMDQIPRKDTRVQELLRPFVHRVENKQQKKRKKMNGTHDSDSNESEEELKPVAGKKRKRENDSNLSEEEQKSTAGQEKSKVETDSDSTEESSVEEQTKCQPKKEEKKPSWKISIYDMISSSQNETKKPIAGKVLQKSGLRKYDTKIKQGKFFFYLGIADETDCYKVMVYGKQKYDKYEEGKCYSFRDIIVDREWSVFKVTRRSTISKTSAINVPEDIQVKAQTLLYPHAPVCSIADIKASSENTPVSVDGVIKKINAAERVDVEKQQRKTRRQEFCLSDGEDSIFISLWGEHIQQLRGKSERDSVRVTNVKTKHYYGTTTLNSTLYTRIVTVQSAPVQNVSIEIVGVIKAGKLKTHLEAELNEEVQTLVVGSKHLAAAFGITLDENFEEKLLERIPLSAKAEIKGSKINAITATENV